MKISDLLQKKEIRTGNVAQDLKAPESLIGAKGSSICTEYLTTAFNSSSGRPSTLF